MNDLQMMTVKEVMARLCVSRATIYRWINDGTLPKPITLGRSPRFKQTDISALIERLQQEAA